jgi:hypothetical protein
VNTIRSSGSKTKRVRAPAPRARSNAALAYEQALEADNPALGRRARSDSPPPRKRNGAQKRRRSTGHDTQRQQHRHLTSNAHAFTCPGPCGRHYTVGSTSITLIDEEWVCGRCEREMRPRTVVAGQNRRCATCAVEMRTLAKPNRKGELVHYPRCPKKTIAP